MGKLEKILDQVDAQLPGLIEEYSPNVPKNKIKKRFAKVRAEMVEVTKVPDYLPILIPRIVKEYCVGYKKGKKDHKY